MILIQNRANPDETRVIRENENYDGRQWVAIDSVPDPAELELQKIAQKHGMHLGDMVEAAIRLMPASIRPQHCSKCERRKQGLNWLSEKVMELGEAIVEKLRNA